MKALSRIWKLYLLCLILLVAGVAIAGFVLEAQIKRSLTKYLESNVLTLAKVMARSLPDTKDPSALNAFCKSFRSVAGARITVMDQEGKVIGESDKDVAEGETRMDRPEVQEALQKGQGKSIRFSKTLRIDMLYTAVFLKEKGKIIRLAVPMTMVRAFQNELMIFFSLGLFLAPIFAIIIMFFFMRYAIAEEKKKYSDQLQSTGKFWRPDDHAK